MIFKKLKTFLYILFFKEIEFDKGKHHTLCNILKLFLKSNF